MASKNNQQRQLAEQKERIARDAAKLESLWRGLDSDEESQEPQTYSNRYEVPAPDPRDKSKYNPHNIVDIETFIKHPFYLNLTPYPWQMLTLKLFYMGSMGNTNLELNAADKKEEKNCDKCVWKYVLDNEILAAQNIEKGETPQNILKPINSRCLKCLRCPLAVRNTKIDYAIENSGEISEETALKELKELELEDFFQSELDLIDEVPDEAVKMQIKNKLGKKFRELVLIMGRRGGKSFLTVTIALYELYKLLSMNHPQKKLGLPDFQEIHILNVAKNEDQAKDSIFTPMKNMAVASPFFQKYIGVDNTLEMKFLTEKDIEENTRRKAKSLTPLDGTIILKCGSSSAGGLVGKTCWCIIIDELAAMAGDNPNGGDDKKLYNELKPSLKTFEKDGKIICLSNPKGPFGQLFNLYNTRLEDNSTLILKLPTWMINANINAKDLMEEKRQDPVEFNMQFGAEFGTNSENPFLDPEDVAHAFINSQRITRLEQRENNYDFYCHIDPANRNDYYTLVVGHIEQYGDFNLSGTQKKRFYVDHIQYWAPQHMKQPVNIEVVENYIIDLHKKFSFKQISFDQWHSAETIERLQNQGLPAVLKVFNKEYKDKIYINLLEMFRSKSIEFYKMSAGTAMNKSGKIFEINEIPEAKDQFTFLQKKWKNGKQTIEALSGYKDDICDATAACLYECSQEQAYHKKFPRARIAYTGRAFR
jgi:hypothetical protein